MLLRKKRFYRRKKIKRNSRVCRLQKARWTFYRWYQLRIVDDLFDDDEEEDDFDGDV